MEVFVLNECGTQCALWESKACGVSTASLELWLSSKMMRLRLSVIVHEDRDGKLFW